jgi:single-strand DNA-binding protein
MWNKMAESAKADVKKGSRISVTGRLSNRTYTDKEGNKKYSTEIIAVSYETVAVTSETKAVVL